MTIVIARTWTIALIVPPTSVARIEQKRIIAIARITLDPEAPHQSVLRSRRTQPHLRIQPQSVQRLSTRLTQARVLKANIRSAMKSRIRQATGRSRLTMIATRSRPTNSNCLNV